MAVIEQMKAMRRDGAAYRAIGAVTGHGPKSVQRIWSGWRERTMKLSFCAAWVRQDLQHHNLITRGEAGSDDERNLITLCGSCQELVSARRTALGAATRAERARAFTEVAPVAGPTADLSATLRPKS